LRCEKSDLPIVLIGTKADLEDEDLKVPDDEIQDILKKYDLISYVRTSSKTGEGVTRPIEILVDHMHAKIKNEGL
ncbi:MAG: hypothetical protein ACTSWN_16180, partial [Promethearchaeota archaeon]